MSDDDLPEAPPSEPPGPTSIKDRARERVRARLESVIPEILKRVVEVGVEKARESPGDVKQFLHDMKVPKEIAHYLLQQMDDTKNGLFRVVAKEIRDFLEHTNFAGEVQKLLTTVQFEVNTTIRFTPNDGREPRNNTDGGQGEPRPRGARADQASDEGEVDEDDGERDEDSDGNGEGGEVDRVKQRSLPRPEVKTSVRVRERERSDRRANEGVDPAARRRARGSPRGV